LVEKTIFWIITTLVGIVAGLLTMLWKGQAKEIEELKEQLVDLKREIDNNEKSSSAATSAIDRELHAEFVTRRDYRETVNNLFEKIEKLNSRLGEQHSNILQAIYELKSTIAGVPVRKGT